MSIKEEEVKNRKSKVNTAELEKRDLFSRDLLSLKIFIGKIKTGIIAEFKRRSPSKGIINPDVDVLEVTTAYTKYGASCIICLN